MHCMHSPFGAFWCLLAATNLLQIIEKHLHEFCTEKKKKKTRAVQLTDDAAC